MRTRTSLFSSAKFEEGATEMRTWMRRMILTAVCLHALLCGCADLQDAGGSESLEAPEIAGQETVTIREGMTLNADDFLSVETMQTCKSHTVTGALDTDHAGVYPITLTVVGEDGGITIRSVRVAVISASESEALDSGINARSEDPDLEPEENDTEDSTQGNTKAGSSDQTGKTQKTDTAEADPYAAEKAYCLETYGTWQGTYCIWPTPTPDSGRNENAGGSARSEISGGTTSCWDYIGDDGRSYHECEWVSDWEEY